jgi:membrane protein DedA with SNARE-associated domain
MQHFIVTYGYLAVFILMVAESACIPVPSELIMPLAGALAAGAVAGHHLSLTLVIVAGVAGNVVGSYIAWAVGWFGGQAALRRWGGRFWLREHDIEVANRWFDRYGPRAVLIGRLLPVVRTFISLPAGIARMRPLRFGLYTTIGCIPWTAALAIAGYAIGANWQQIPNAFHTVTYIVAAIVVIALVIGAWLFIRYRRAERRGGVHAAADPANHESPAQNRADTDA